MGEIKTIRFGIPTLEFRTNYGSLRTRELERIMGFLNRRGIILADCFERKIVIIHPDLMKESNEEMTAAGFQTLLIGSTVSNIRQCENLNLMQNRVLEAFTPGALIVNRYDDNDAGLISVAVPDDPDLRDICSLYGGTLRVFVTDTYIQENDFIECLKTVKLDGLNMNVIGVLECQYCNEDSVGAIATVVNINGSNDIELVKPGVYDFDIVRQASAKYSQYEMGEWI